MQRAPGPVTRDVPVRRRRAEEDPSRRRPGLGAVGAAALAVFGALALAGVVAAAAVIGTYLALTRDLKSPSELERIQLQEESIVYDRTGKVELARFGETRREVVTFEEIPPIVVDATTAVEDKTFWTNAGFDPAAIVAAGLDTLRGEGRGASTITQQLVRQRLLEPELVQNPDRRVERKLKEIIQSIRVTRAYSLEREEGKRKIITAYLNQNYYGNNTYGIKAAAKGYFGLEDLHELSLAQAAILAGIPQSPTEFDLFRNAEEQDDGSLVVPPESDVVERRNFILDLLAEGRAVLSRDEYTAADFEAAKAEPVVLAPRQEVRWTAPHFVWAVRREVTTKLCGEDAQTCPQVEQGGLRITTTLDTRLQEIAEKWVKAAAFVPWQEDPKAAAKAIGLDWDEEDWMRNLRRKTLRNGALVALDYQTGELVAYVGSADYYAKGGKRLQTKFDVLADGWRQPGSAFKPFNYATGIDSGRITAATMFMDVVTDFGGRYTPVDADNKERGPVRATDALRFSLNIPAVKAMAVNGVEQVYAKAREFGLVFADDKIDAGLAFALGVEEVHPVDLVTAYGTLANEGRRTGHTTILEIKDRDGKDLTAPHERPDGDPVISPQAAYIVTNMLAGNTDREINPFWGRFAIRAGKDGGRRPATLKTGTNNDALDLNAYGYIAPPSEEGRAAGEYALVVGAWNGNSDNSLVSTAAAPLFSIDVTTYVWEGFLEEAAADWAVNDFARPDGITEHKVDPWTGLVPRDGGRSVTELFIGDTKPARPSEGEACGAGIFAVAGFEDEHDNWLKADREWIQRARRGAGRRGGPKDTPTTYFYDGSFTPYGKSWGAVVGSKSADDPCASPSPSPVCPSVDPVTGSLAPPSGAPSDAPSPDSSACPSPSPSASPSPSPSPEPSPSPVVEPSPPPPSIEPPPSPPASIEPSPSPDASAGAGEGGSPGASP